MARVLVTGSSFHRARICAGSAVLPRVPNVGLAAAIGNATHEWIDRAVSEWTHVRGLGPVEDIADRWELWGEARTTFLRYVRGMGGPPVPAEGLTEVALGLFEDGRVEQIRGGRGEYDGPEDLLFALTIDALWPEVDGKPAHLAWEAAPVAPEGATLAVVDWKTGEAITTPPAAFNWQIRAGAALAAKWTGAKRALPMLGIIDGGPPRWEVPTDSHGYALAMGEDDLAAAEAEVRRVVARVKAQDPEDPAVVVGAHCAYCPSRFACPAHITAPRAMVEIVPRLPSAGPLTRTQARELLTLLIATKEAMKSADAALRDHVLVHGPIRLPDGRVWGPEEKVRLDFDTAGTFDAAVTSLAPLVGEDRALELVHAAFGVTRGNLYDAVSAAVDERNERRSPGEKRVTKKAVMEQLLAAARAVGAVTERTIVEWETRWPDEAA